MQVAYIAHSFPAYQIDPLTDKIHNCDVMIREDVSFLLSLVFTISMLSRYFKITTDEFIDVLIGDDHALRT